LTTAKAEGPLPLHRHFSVVTENLLTQDFWILGGEDEQAILDSTEISESEMSGKWDEVAPKMPRSLSRHCVVRINETHVFLSGGENYKCILKLAHTQQDYNQKKLLAF
jgi:hypothetical protein